MVLGRDMETVHCYGQATKTIAFPGTVRIAAKSELSGPCGLESVVLSAGLEKVGTACFADSRVRKVFVPGSVRVLGNSAFCNSGLREIRFAGDSRLEKIDHCCFRNSMLRAIRIPDGVAELGAYAFYECGRLAWVRFGRDSRLRKIGELCFFKSCPRLVAPPPTVACVEGGAFSGVRAVYLEDAS